MSGESPGPRLDPRFAQRLAHEVRSPAQVVAGALAELSASADGAPSAMLVLAGRALERLERLARRLERLAEVEADGLRVVAQPTDLAAVVRETAEDTARLRRRRVALRLEGVDGPRSWGGDGALVREAVAELVDNAVKHARQQVTVRLVQSGRWLKVIVDDDGPGLPSRSLASLQSSPGRSGLGIGLRLTAALAEAHGGTLRLGEGTSTGSTVELCLPVVPQCE